MGQVKVKLLRPLNGDEVGTTATYDEADAKRLEASGAVKIMGKAEGASTANKSEGASPENKAETITTDTAAPAAKRAGARTARK